MTKEQIKTEYETHKTIGIDFVEDYRAQLALDVVNGTITEKFGIERQDILRVPFEYIKDGDWKSAKVYLSKMLGSTYCDLDTINLLISSIDTYITDNYSF